MIIAITGHRNQDLPFGFDLPNPCYTYICKELEKVFIEKNATKIISGMALGTDLWAAFVANKLKIPVLAAIPFVGQEAIWNESYKKIYSSLLKKASEKVIVSNGGYSPSKMQVRNQWMVDNSDLLVAVWTGKTSGGTYNCVQYAKSLDKEIYQINPLNYEES